MIYHILNPAFALYMYTMCNMYVLCIMWLNIDRKTDATIKHVNKYNAAYVQFSMDDQEIYICTYLHLYNIHLYNNIHIYIYV